MSCLILTTLKRSLFHKVSGKSFWKTFTPPVVGLAPMEGYSDSPFRQVCKTVAPQIITYTEFTSADGLTYKAPKLLEKFHFNPIEAPVIAQIFGKNEASFASAARFCEDLGFAGIDLNMGCPAKKVVKSEHGIALRRNHDLAFRLISAVAKATQLPVSVKTRLGWSDASDLIAFGRGAENAGADMICIHARTYQEPYGVPAVWGPVYDLKKSLTIPVYGNGGITRLEEGFQRVQNLDGFLIGQAAIGNPWVFLPEAEQPLHFAEKAPIIRQHAAWMIQERGELNGMRQFRKHFLQYVKGIHNAKALRSDICHVASLSDVDRTLEMIIQGPMGQNEALGAA